LNVKIVSILCLILFALASPIVTITTTFVTWTPNVLGITETATYNIESGRYQPTGGDPIDGDFPPGYIEY
jgi:hypothetical protein